MSSAKKTVSAQEDFLEWLFTSKLVQGLCFLSIKVLNVNVLYNAYVSLGMASMDHNTDAWIFSIALNTIMCRLVIREQDWSNALCPGAIVLYLDLIIDILYFGALNFIIGEWWGKFALTALFMLMLVVGMFIIIVVKASKKNK